MKIYFNKYIFDRLGNPIHCDCHARPLKRWLKTQTHFPAEWSDVICQSPHYLASKPLSEVTEDLMSCNERDIQEKPELDITPDVKYRSID